KIEVTAADNSKQTVEALHIIIATGGRSRQIPALPIDGNKIIGYREAMILPNQPTSMIIVGSGAIGVEFGYFYNSIGTKVTIVEFMPRVVPVEDEEISKELEKNFKKQGIAIMTSSEVTKVDTSGDGVRATVKTANGEVALEADILLSAVGIQANIEGIGLEELGVKTERGLIAVDKYGQTSVPGIYAIGDCTPGQALAHVASKEGIVCVENIAYTEKKYHHQPEPVDYGNVPGCTYCSPEIASVGLTEAKAREAGYDVKVGKFPLSASGKATAAGHQEGFIKVIFDAKYGEWLGTHMIGYNVTELIAETVVARKLETTYHEVLNSIHPHPTISESTKDAIEVAYGEAIHL
ncbi:MAG: FAD-dependent oxidoreductase, partial [Flavisolibacter sp.]|nr:FAD-dependent oxidoreductase [Flavisolibacter sp.]